MWWSLLSNLVAIEDFLRKIQRIPCGAGMVRGPSGFLSYPTSLSHTLARTRKGLAGRFYQLLSGHAAAAEHLMQVGKVATDRC